MISKPHPTVLDGLLGGKSGHDGSNMGGCAGTLIANNFILTSAHCLLKGALPFACDRVPGHVGDLLDIDRFSFVINEHQISKDIISQKIVKWQSLVSNRISKRIIRSKSQSADDIYDRKLGR